MPRNSNRYRGAAARSGKRATTAGSSASPASRRGVRRALAAIRARLHRPRPGRELLIIGALTLAVIVGLGSFGGAYLLYRWNHDWTGVATVNGHSISREALRGRMAVLSLLAGERAAFISEAVSAGNLSSDEAKTLEGEAAAATTLGAARESLIDDELLAQLAARDGVATPANPDPWDEATAYAAGDFARRVRYVRFGLAAPAATTPTATAADETAAAARVRAQLATNTPVETIVAGLHDADWQVFGQDVSVSAQGLPADSSLDLDPTIAAGTVRGTPGQIVGPTTDAYGRISLGLLLPNVDTTTVSRRLPFDADKAKLDTAALQSWANGRALHRAVTAKLISGWSKGVAQTHFREFVIGAAPDSSGIAGPWVELSSLGVDRLKGVTPSSIAGAPSGLDLSAEALAKTLKSMSQANRSTLFRTLVAAANKASGASTTTTSGEIGFYTKDGLVPDLGKAAFADATRSGDVLGPISTAAGPALYLVEARYAGALDDRSRIALAEIRNDPAPGPLLYTQRFSPTDTPLAADAGWRAQGEFAAGEPVRAALFDTPIGGLSDPFVLDGKLALALVGERRTAVPEARMLDRLTLDGCDSWFASEYAKAAITRSDDPLPELMPSPSASRSSASALPTAPTLDTPNLPAIPGRPTAAIPTDAMGLPAVP